METQQKYRRLQTSTRILWVKENEDGSLFITDDFEKSILDAGLLINQLGGIDKVKNRLQGEELTKEEAVNHPRKNVLMRALGANNQIDVDIFDVDTSCDGIFLCSDGLTNMLSVSQIEKVLNSDLNIEEKIVKLIKKSNLRGGTDNISIACLQKESGE